MRVFLLILIITIIMVMVMVMVIVIVIAIAIIKLITVAPCRKPQNPEKKALTPKP